MDDNQRCIEVTVSTVLIIEDEAVAAMTLAWIVEDMGHTVLGAVGTGEEAMDIVSQTAPDLILSDIRILGRRDGVEIVQEILVDNNPRVVFVTASADEKTKGRVSLLGPHRIVCKPYCDHDIIEAVTEALCA